MSYKHPVTGRFISRQAWFDLQHNDEPNDNLANIIRDTLASESSEVDAMVIRVNNALEERRAFELSKSPNGSHVELRRAISMFRDSRVAAAFFVAVNADVEQLFNRTRKNGTRANLKGFRKVRQLIDYITGKTGVFERVSLALFASTIIAADMGLGWIASQEQELILSKEPVKSLPREVQEAIKDYQHKHMTLEGDSRNQSCMFRTTFANLNCYFFSKEEFDNVDYSLGIMVNMESPIIRYLRDRWQLNTVQG